MLLGYFFGLATPPACLGLYILGVALLTPSNYTMLRCGCGRDWGSPHDRRWPVWWVAIRLRLHDLTTRHRDFIRQERSPR